MIVIDAPDPLIGDQLAEEITAEGYQDVTVALTWIDGAPKCYVDGLNASDEPIDEDDRTAIEAVAAAHVPV